MAIKVAGTIVISDDRNVNNVGVITASSIVKSSGTSSQFLKADGSVDSNTYVTSSGSVASATDAKLNIKPKAARVSPFDNFNILHFL